MSQFYTTPSARGSSAAAEVKSSAESCSVSAQGPGIASAAAPAPREGLPPCVKALAIGDGRLATWSLICGHPDHWAEVLGHYDSFIVAIEGTPQVPHLVRIAETDDRVVTWAGLPVPGVRKGTVRILTATDDPAEAEAAWERAERWVRMGVLGGD